ncbi:ciliogenesis-associated TTC17-interacting protein isoform X2 [Ochotona princeps]|uniref:ciliogenesis-associated TTC17-interacting protein isoform X2 n=1 Tax=Ochotona princeps TaxID=9978 RepID=UPI002714D569|nr:ciliogenesis-associated TTC17-interacting protein isoform X2 [Ochotona princeps]
MSSKAHFTGGLKTKEHRLPDHEVAPLPQANAEAINFLNSLGLEELQMLLFSETLAMVTDAGEPQGELTIEVQKGRYTDPQGILIHCIMVHASSHGFLDKMLCGNSLLGYLSWKLEPMEQHSHEFIKFLILPMERTTNLLRQEEQLSMTRSVKEGEQSLGFQTIQVGWQQAPVFIVEQTVHSEEGIPMAWQFYLLSDGHLAKRVQIGSPGCCIITKMPILREEDEIEPPPVFEKKPLVWEEDLELHSKFLHRKEELRTSHSSYLRQHPDVRALLSDFLLFLLLRQPRDVVTFAAEFFGPFDPSRPPPPSLRSSHRPSPFRSWGPGLDVDPDAD